MFLSLLWSIKVYLAPLEVTVVVIYIVVVVVIVVVTDHIIFSFGQ